MLTLLYAIRIFRVKRKDRHSLGTYEGPTKGGNSAEARGEGMERGRPSPLPTMRFGERGTRKLAQRGSRPKTSFRGSELESKHTSDADD